mgnify:CR=1 FL=1
MYETNRRFIHLVQYYHIVEFSKDLGRNIEVVEENDDPATNLNKIVDNLTNNVITNNEKITNITNARNTTNENGIKKQPLLVNPIPIQK